MEDNPAPVNKDNSKIPTSPNHVNSLKNFINTQKRLSILIIMVFIAILCSAYYMYRVNNDKKVNSLYYQNLIPPILVPYREVDKSVTSENKVVDLKNYNIASPDYKINFDFAKYSLVETQFKPALPQYSVSTSELYNLTNFEQILKIKFSDAQLSALNGTNFFITPNLDKFWSDDLDAGANRSDDWTGLYSGIGGGSIFERAPQNSVFITSDVLLHVYHKLLEKEFEYVEDKNFYPSLKAMTDNVLSLAIQEYPKQSDPENKSSFERIIAFFAVPKAILDSAAPELSQDTLIDQATDTNQNILNDLENLKTQIPDYSYQKAKAELNLVLDAKAMEASPLFDEFLSKEGLSSLQDYTQFTPRSHYNKNSILRSYFRAMMWYGRNDFALTSPELTRDALNISLLTKNAGQLKNWADIYVPTSFLVGKSDDLGIFEYNSDLEKIGTSSVGNDTVTKVQEDMKSYQGPLIQASAFVGNNVFSTSKADLLDKTKGFRFMGQRFTPDAFIFTSLTQGDEAPDPVTGQRLPSSTTALMVMSILGNKTADPLVQNWIQKNASDSSQVLANNLASLKDQFSKITVDTWTQNIYWGWLYTIKSLFTEDVDKTGYPNFIRTDEWNAKNLQASLGSWTELKHDTLLYAKQTYAELGGGGDTTPPPVPKGYVEPNIPFFDRLIALDKLTVDGLKSRGLLNETFAGRNENFISTLNFLKGIAVKELQNEKISDDDFETLRTEGRTLSSFLGPLPGEEVSEKDVRSALIADVQTDVSKGQILYEADGIPNYIYVAVKDQNGTRLTKGLVFSYYEYNAPLSQRLTDQDWWKLNYTQDKSKLPAIPDWTKILYK